MHGHKMHERVFAHSIEVGWAEQEAIIRYCLWSQESRSLLDWLADTPAEDICIHIAGKEAAPVVLDVHPDGPIKVLADDLAQEGFAPDGEILIVFQVRKSEAIEIVRKRGGISAGDIEAVSQVYVDFAKPRFVGEPFVHLTVGKRSLPIRVPLAL